MDNVMYRLVNNELWNRVVKTDTVAVLLGGSRRMQITDDRSDYDLVVLSVNRKDFKREIEYVKCEGKKVHWYTETADLVLHPEQDSYTLFLSGNQTWKFVKDEDFLYINEQYRYILEEILQNKEQISRKSAELLSRNCQSLIVRTISNNAIAEKDYTKYLYHLCIASFVSTGETISDEAKNYLLEIKRIRWQETTEASKNWCIGRLRILNAIYALSDNI